MQAQQYDDHVKKHLTNDELKARANRLHLAHLDMVEVKHYIDALDALACVRAKDDSWSSLVLGDAIPAIYIAIITVYARPFVNSYSKGTADPKLIPEDIQLFDNDCELEAFHNQIVALRSKAVAHADWTHHSTRLITDDKTFGLKREHSQPQYLQDINIALLLRLVEHVRVTTSSLAYDTDVLYQTEIERSEATLPTDDHSPLGSPFERC